MAEPAYTLHKVVTGWEMYLGDIPVALFYDQHTAEISCKAMNRLYDALFRVPIVLP